MPMLSDKSYKKFKEISEKEGIKYNSKLEMRQSADNLVRFVDTLVKIDQKEQELKRQLESQPKGFALEGKGRSCSLCDRSIYEGDGWYDKWGFKCMTCQKAVDKKIIPGSLCGDWRNEKCITDSGLAYKSGLYVQTIKKLIRQGKIKARQIPNGPYVIIRKDNKDIDIPKVLEKERREQQVKQEAKHQRKSD